MYVWGGFICDLQPVNVGKKGSFMKWIIYVYEQKRSTLVEEWKKLRGEVRILFLETEFKFEALLLQLCLKWRIQVFYWGGGG